MSDQTSEKKVVSRTIAIGLGIVCIILLVGLVGAILVYSSMINEKDNKISVLNQQLTNKDIDIHSLNSQVAYLTSIANLTKSTIWVGSKTIIIQAGSEAVWNATANYAGYVSVQVYSSTTGNTYVRVTYSSHGVNYDDQINVGIGGTAVFPVLPASIQISVGNPGTAVANATVTITYYY
jgi:predicted PurR-regulated permease PerM